VPIIPKELEGVVADDFDGVVWGQTGSGDNLVSFENAQRVLILPLLVADGAGANFAKVIQRENCMITVSPSNADLTLFAVNLNIGWSFLLDC
jgi:hypothetical protein